MKVLKFGGTSVGTPQRMGHVADIIRKEEGPVIVVLSAVAGTTNKLVSIAEAWKNGETETARKESGALYQDYETYIKDLLADEKLISEAKENVKGIFDRIFHIVESEYDDGEYNEILIQGELISTYLFHRYLTDKRVHSQLLDALDIMVLDEEGEPDYDAIQAKLSSLDFGDGTNCHILQGYICRDHEGNISNLQRGGSDYTASIVGSLLNAYEVQIWTDIDGMHNNDPRYVKKTFPVAQLSFEEAAELAYFGAKILHPASIRPAQLHNVPVRLLNTLNPGARGTIVNGDFTPGGIKAIAAKDGIVAIKIKSGRMLLAYGFLRRIFEIFEKYTTPVDMITTSEVAVSLTIDDRTHLGNILKDLEKLGQVTVDQNQTIVCIVGDMVAEKEGIVDNVFSKLKDVPIRMISYGGSKHNISILIDSKLKKKVLNDLNEVFTINQDEN